MIAPWLDRVLAEAATLDLHHPDARAQLAERLVAAAGGESPRGQALVIAETIKGSAHAVLKQKISSTQLGQAVLVDAEYASRIAHEIGNNAAGTVILVLAVGPDVEAA